MPQTLREIALGHSDFLIERSKNGDQHAFGKLVGLWFKRIYNFSYKYFDDHDMAMEVTQKTFIAVHGKINSLRENSSFKYWLYKIASNQCNEEGRRQQRKDELYAGNLSLAEQIADSQALPGAYLETEESKQKIDYLLAQLPPEQKQVVIMKEFEGLKFKEIAQVLQLSENTVKSRLYYGLKALRKLVDEKKYSHD